ncbi:hypothetical protein Tco_0240550 [Tanacetum coccineum]
MKRIFRYLKGQPILGVWYPKDSPFDLEAHTDSDYAGASLDKKFTAGAEYVAAASCCRQYAQMMLETAVDDEFQVSSVGLTYYWENLIDDKRTLLDPPWSELELHLRGDEFLSKDQGARVVTKEGYRMSMEG